MAPKPNRTRQALLGFLTWGPMSGYDLKRAIEGSISNFWSESYGQIYPILRQLEAEGFATCERQETAGGRQRNVYSITEAGRAELRSWLGEPTPSHAVRHEELLKLFFGNQADVADNVARIEAYREELLADRDRYDQIGERLRGAKNAPIDREYWLMTLRYGELETKSRLEWCDETLAALRALTLAESPPEDD